MRDKRRRRTTTEDRATPLLFFSQSTSLRKSLGGFSQCLPCPVSTLCLQNFSHKICFNVLLGFEKAFQANFEHFFVLCFIFKRKVEEFSSFSLYFFFRDFSIDLYQSMAPPFVTGVCISSEGSISTESFMVP